MRAATSRRTRLQAVAAVLLGLNGAAAIRYARFVPIPPLSEAPVPPRMEVLGVVGLLAAVGVWLHQAWGRWLGVLATVAVLAFAFSRATGDHSPLGTPWGVASYTIDLALSGLVL